MNDRALKAACERKEGEKEPTKLATAKVATLRDSAKNPWLMALTALCEPGFYFDIHLIVCGTLPYRHFMGYIRTHVISVEGSQTAHTKYALAALLQREHIDQQVRLASARSCRPRCLRARMSCIAAQVSR